MKIYILALAVFIFGWGCGSNDQSNSTTETAKDSIYSKENLSFGCYRMIIGQDSALMKLELRGADSVVGMLQYNRFEKDDNTGLFVGKVDNNKVVGWYNFQSEGVITVRQVIFKIVGDKLAEGYGDVEASSDTAFFSYPQTLNYEEGHPFQKINCPDSATNKL